MVHHTKSVVTLIELRFTGQWTADLEVHHYPERILGEKVECSV